MIRKFDLRERFLKFITEIISLTRRLPQDRTNLILISQIIRSATSIGANYEEADGARSKKEFMAIMGISKKEAKETKYWLEIIKMTNNKFAKEIQELQNENEELIKIIAKIIINSSS